MSKLLCNKHRLHGVADPCVGGCEPAKELPASPECPKCGAIAGAVHRATCGRGLPTDPIKAECNIGKPLPAPSITAPALELPVDPADDAIIDRLKANAEAKCKVTPMQPAVGVLEYCEMLDGAAPAEEVPGPDEVWHGVMNGEILGGHWEREPSEETKAYNRARGVETVRYVKAART